MPTSTFFRLPEEKRERLMDAAWAEFTSTSFTDASINRIIHSARIPRGSFYQYFQDKEDLFWHLLGEIRQYFFGVFEEVLRETRGDLFPFPVHVFDRFMDPTGSTDPILQRCIQIMQLNPGFDFRNLLFRGGELMTAPLLEMVDLSGFRRKDPAFVNHICILLVAALAYAVMETTQDPEQWKRQREILEERIEIVKWGGLFPEGKGGPAQEGGHTC